MRLSPVSPANDIADSDPQALFDHVVAAARAASAWPTSTSSRARPAARANQPAPSTSRRCATPSTAPTWPITATTWTLAQAALRGGKRADLVAFGRPFIANPDLVERLRAGRR